MPHVGNSLPRLEQFGIGHFPARDRPHELTDGLDAGKGPVHEQTHPGANYNLVEIAAYLARFPPAGKGLVVESGQQARRMCRRIRQFRAYEMTTRSGVQSVAGSIVERMLRVMCRKLLPAYVDGVLVGALANLLRCHLHSIGQHVAKTFPLGQFLGHSHDGFVIAPGHFQTICVGLADQPLIVAFNGEGNGSPGGDGVQACAVADVVGHDYRFQVVIKTIGAEHGNRFIFRSAGTGLVFILSGPSLHIPSAPDWALVTGKHLRPALNDSLDSDGFRVGKVDNPHP